MTFFVTNISLYDKEFPNSNTQKKIFFHSFCYKRYSFTFTFLKTIRTTRYKSMSKETLTSTFTELRKGFLRLAMRFLPNKEDATMLFRRLSSACGNMLTRSVHEKKLKHLR